MSIHQPAWNASASAWLVYGDQLQEAGDLRGELIALNDAAFGGERIEERDAFVARHATSLFGGYPLQELTVEWGRWLAADVAVHLEGDEPARLEPLLRSPMGRGTRRLSLRVHTPNADVLDLCDTAAVVARTLSPTCKALALIDERAFCASTLVSQHYAPDINLVHWGPLSHVLAVPHLESLTLHVADPGQLDFENIAAPQLQELGLYGLRWPGADDGYPTELCDALASASWPSLRRFAARLPERYVVEVADNDGAYLPVERYDRPHHVTSDYRDGYHSTVNWPEVIGPLLQSFGRTRLEQLALHSFSSSALLLRAVIEAHLPHLRRLDLSESDINDQDAEWMLRNTGRFEHLETIDLSETLVTSRMAEMLGALQPRVVHSYGGARHRYLVGRE